MATIALLLWPFIALFIFAHAAIVPAILSATIVPYLFLPEAFKIELPFVPDLDKTTIITIGLVGGLIFFGGRARKRADLPTLTSTSRWFRFLLVSLVATLLVGSILTVVNNREMLFFGPTILPALGPWDVVGNLGDLALLLTPFIIAYGYLASPVNHRTLLKAFVIAGLLYSILMLVEMRLSPQLHVWVYGYRQHSWLQHVRDGYRPMVFLQHGIWVGFFMFMTLLGAAALWKVEKDAKWLWAGGWLFIILINSENLGASAIAVFFLAVLLGLWPKAQIWVIAAIALSTLLYPALRQAELVPIEQILSVAERISEKRAQSLEFRFRNEDQLLERAFQKPLTGWGGWSRDRIFNELGNEISISEGIWILTIGSSGWIGYVGMFGLLTLPLIALTRTSRRKDIPQETIALALICSGNLIYMIPNATLTPVGLLCFGALAGFVGAKDHNRRERATSRYTRFSQTSTRVISEKE